MIENTVPTQISTDQVYNQIKKIKKNGKRSFQVYNQIKKIKKNGKRSFFVL
jgi:predicted CopG family antitoxin